MDLKRAVELYEKYNEDYVEFLNGRHAITADGELSEEFKALIGASQYCDFVLYDAWSGESSVNPKVIFILDPQRYHYDEDIASLVQTLMQSGLLSDKDCVLLEGSNGVLDYEHSLSKNGKKFYFGIKHPQGVGGAACSSDDYIAVLYEQFRQNQIPVFFNDNVNLCSRIGRLSSHVRKLEEAVKEFPESPDSDEKQKMREQCIEGMMQAMLDRSNDYFLKGIKENLATRNRVFQVFGAANHIIGNMQKRLKEEGISYATFIPKQAKGTKKPKKLIKPDQDLDAKVCAETDETRERFESLRKLDAECLRDIMLTLKREDFEAYKTYMGMLAKYDWEEFRLCMRDYERNFASINERPMEVIDLHKFIQDLFPDHFPKELEKPYNQLIVDLKDEMSTMMKIVRYKKGNGPK